MARRAIKISAEEASLRIEAARVAAANKLKVASNKAILRLDNAATEAAHKLNTSAVDAATKLSTASVDAATKLATAATEASNQLGISANEAGEKLSQAADRAVEKIDTMLLKIGIDVDDPDATVSLKKDIVYAHSMRVTSEVIRGQGLKAAIWTLVPAVLAFIGYLFRNSWVHH
jgi:hypothetical protein